MKGKGAKTQRRKVFNLTGTIKKIIYIIPADSVFPVNCLKNLSVLAFWRICVLISLFAFSLFAQTLPDEIRGYKVHNAKISVTNETVDRTEKDKSEAYARLTEPELTDTSLSGLTFEISAEIEPLDYNGRIDFLTFRNFKVNGLEVEIEEYTNSFEVKKNQAITLPRPVKIVLGAGQALKGALNEMRDSKEEWTVTGTVFVFGRFKKWGFSAKRVVPVEVDVKIKNPLRKENTLSLKIPSF